MAKTIDRALAWLLILGGCGHTIGSFQFFRWLSPELVFALGTSLAIWLIAAANLMRVNRPHDRTLAWACVVGSTTWAVLSVAFGFSIDHPLDPRPVVFTINSLALAGFSLRGLFPATSHGAAIRG